MKKFFLIIMSFAVSVAICFTSCVNEEEYTKDSSVKLQFSADTVSFDTIFTTIGSVTKQIRVFNPENKAVKLDYITLGGGNHSYFRLNVDGDTSLTVRNIEIPAKDYIFIFIRTELDINNQSNPLLIEDSIIFAFNTKTQSVLLSAYGQDAYYHKPTHSLKLGETIVPYSLVNEGGKEAGVELNGNDVSWKTDKPHVIIGTCVVDSAFTLNLSDNTQIYMGNNSDFWVYKDGTLNASGTTSNPVVFQSLRTQERYADIPGQWGKIWFWAGSKDNKLDNTVVKNATIGIVADTCVNDNHTLELKNTRIENCSSYGLYARGADIYGENVLVQNIGSYAVALTIGGSYEFIGCTFANYWSYSSTRNDAVLLLNDWYEAADGTVQYRRINKCDFHNTVIYGSLFDNEVELDLSETLNSSYTFDHCLIKSSILNNNGRNIVSCIFNKDPQFEDVSLGDLHPSESSPLIKNGNGIYNSVVPYDIYGIYRSDPPCIGAVEYVRKAERTR
ncbi:MAG: hypothetical protein IJ681_05930 [Bacteroidales bacterium]|nr:hypothetical protein [Bacteroidales bacterium]